METPKSAEEMLSILEAFQETKQKRLPNMTACLGSYITTGKPFLIADLRSMPIKDQLYRPGETFFGIPVEYQVEKPVTASVSTPEFSVLDLGKGYGGA